jgi:phosphoribosyl-ATP pyrophosphohydrolase/phosphoribosyl-AMP cyclohydrolase
MNKELVKGLEDLTDVPYILCQKEYDLDEIERLLSSDKIRGIYGDFINDTSMDIMNLKSELSERNILMDNFAPKLKWSDLNTNSDGLVPCIVQDYRTDEVLMLAYMNEESLQKTIETKLATYYSRSRQALWVKGETSGHYQHVKEILVDCDEDTILIKVEQEGAACHTGKYSCFYRNIEGEEIL